jgi:hypothetical protein
MGADRVTDSRIDTYEHIAHVQRYLGNVIADLQRRALVHDASKLESPERDGYDELGWRLRGQEWGSEGYRAALSEMRPVIDHHFARNAHHPEHYPSGIQGMNLLDLVEMLCDWKGAGMRSPGTTSSLRKSIEASQERFGYSDELMEIFLNTIPVIEGETDPVETFRESPERARCLYCGSRFCDAGEGCDGLPL